MTTNGLNFIRLFLKYIYYYNKRLSVSNSKWDFCQLVHQFWVKLIYNFWLDSCYVYAFGARPHFVQ